MRTNLLVVLGAMLPFAPAQDGAGERAFAERAALPPNAVIDFCGDAITCRGGHVDRLAEALAAHRPGLHAVLHKRGLDGGRIADLLHGAKDLHGTSQAALAEVFAADKPTAAVILIGIDDVRHQDRTPPATFEQSLRELLETAALAHVPLVLCTPTAIGERAPGSNELDAELDGCAATIRRLAAQTGTMLCDLRAEFARTLAVRNRADRRDGVLTRDGVQMNEAGDAVLADAIGAALARLLPPDDAKALAELRRRGIAPLVPYPHRLQFGDGDCRLAPAWQLTTAGGLEPVAAASPLRRLPGCGGIATGAPRPGDVAVALDGSLPDGGYRLDIDDAVRLTGHDARAVAFGLATVQQLAVVEGEAVTLPRLAIVDAPDCGYRGLLVDVARRPHPIAVLEQLVRLCSYYKIAHLQLHLTDDQAFTFPSTAFAKAVTRDHSYTLAELRALDDFAAARGVTLVPELDVPGHCGALIAALPELFRAHPKHHATIAFAKPEVLAAVDTLIGEMLAVFRHTPFFHVGGDEADLEHVAESPVFQAAFAREGVADAGELYRRFLVQLRDVVHARGKRMIVWEGFGPGGKVAIPNDVIVMPFESLYHLPDQLAAAGHPLINASWQPLYVVNDRCWPETWIHGWNVRRFEHFIDGYPAWRGIEIPATANVLGAQLCAWEQPAERELPSLRRRLAALAERTWSTGSGRDGGEFLQRLAFTDQRLERALAR